MSEKRFEEQMRASLADYPSSLDKQAMYADFKRRKKRRVLPMWPTMLVLSGGLLLAYGLFSLNDGSTDLNSTELSSVQHTNQRSETRLQNTQTKVLKETKQSELKQEGEIAQKETTTTIAIAEHKQGPKNLLAPVTTAINGNVKKEQLQTRLGGEIEGDGLKNAITIAPRVGTALQLLPRSVLFVSTKDKEIRPELALQVPTKIKSDPILRRKVQLAPIASFSIMTDSKLDPAIYEHQADMISFGIQAHVPIQKTKHFGILPTLNYSKYNLTKEGTIEVAANYEQLPKEALSQMITSIDNESYNPDTASVVGIGYISQQEVNSLSLGCGLVYQRPIFSSFNLELSWNPQVVWSFSSDGDWQNSTRTVFLDNYKVDNLNRIHLMSTTSIGLEKNYGNGKTLKFGFRWNTDLTERRSISNNYDRLSGFGGYLGFGFDL